MNQNTSEPTCSRASQNPVDRRLNALVESVSGWSAVFAGALSVLLAEIVAENLPVGEGARTVALLPLVIGLLYGLLWVAHRYERTGE
jgi:hypothetical protein